MSGPSQIVVRMAASQYGELNALAEQLGITLSEMIREMVEKCIPEYRQRAKEEGEKLRAAKTLREQVEEATHSLVDDMRKGRLVLSPRELTAPKALALADLILRIRPEDEDSDPLLKKLRAAWLKALQDAPAASLPEPIPKPERIRSYSKRKREQ